MDAKITQFTLVVKDQSKALEFYTKRVGFEKKTDFTPPGGYRWVTVGPRGQDMELALFQAGTQDANHWSSSWKPGNNPPIVMQVDDVQKMAADLKSWGIRFIQEPQEYAWGVSATFADPDGNMLSINQPPPKPSRS
jgi:predicted enzyme related to lactoylglutathione lyase